MPAWSRRNKRLEIQTQILHKYLHLGSTEQFYTSFNCRMWFFFVGFMSMLLMNLMSNLRNNLSSILGFFFLFWWLILTNRASKMLLHQLFAFTFVCLGKSHFLFLFLFSLVTLSGTNVKGMFCFQKVSCSFYLISAFLLLPQFHFHEWNWLYYFTKQKIWRSWYISYWSNAM